MSKPSNKSDDSQGEVTSNGEPAQPNSVDSIDQSIINKAKKSESKTLEYGGPAGLEPTRYGDWESKGRCIDF